MTDHHGCDAGFGVPSDGVGVVDGLKRARSLSYGFQRARAGAHNHADAALSMACTPVRNVGSSTGAKRGE